MRGIFAITILSLAGRSLAAYNWALTSADDWQAASTVAAPVNHGDLETNACFGLMYRGYENAFEFICNNDGSWTANYYSEGSAADNCAGVAGGAIGATGIGQSGSCVKLLAPGGGACSWCETGQGGNEELWACVLCSQTAAPSGSPTRAPSSAAPSSTTAAPSSAAPSSTTAAPSSAAPSSAAPSQTVLTEVKDDSSGAMEDEEVAFYEVVVLMTIDPELSAEELSSFEAAVCDEVAPEAEICSVVKKASGTRRRLLSSAVYELTFTMEATEAQAAAWTTAKFEAAFNKALTTAAPESTVIAVEAPGIQLQPAFSSAVALAPVAVAFAALLSC